MFCVAVMFQRKTDSQQGKLSVSQTNVAHGSKAFYADLNCQSLQSFMKPTINPELSDNINLMSVALDRRLLYDVKIKDQIWVLSRVNLQGNVVGKLPFEKILLWNSVN